MLWICGSVTNKKDEAQAAHIRVKVNFPHEDEVFDYHYAPYYWDSSKLSPGDQISLKDQQIQRSGGTIGKVLCGKFTSKWEKKADFEDADYGEADFKYSPPHASLRYRNVRDALYLQQELESGETSTFALAFLTNYEAITPQHQSTLQTALPEFCREAARKRFQQWMPAGTTELTFPAENWDKIFAHLPIGISQLLIQFPHQEYLVPTQGGSSERHFVWVGECVFMLMPLLRLGIFEPVRQALDYVFSLQDGPCPPKGRLTTTTGAVGTSGPKWLNTTGVALALASEYYAYSKDEKFLEEYLPRLLRAMNWIVGELRATRRVNEDGSRPPWYGLMPFGCATDGDIGYIVAFTDAYTFWGLEKTVLLLEQTGHEQAREYRAELELYRRDMTQAVIGLTRPDGFIARKIATGDPDEEVYGPFDQICGAFHLAAGNAIDVDDPIFQRYIEYFERRQGEDLFFGRMDHDTAYMSIAEWMWHEIYLRRGEWKKAFALMQINFKYCKTRDTHQTQERFRLSDPTFCPWQPNGSANGRLLDMMIKSIYYERGDTATLFAGVPFARLRENEVTELKNLHTSRGVLSLKATMVDLQRCQLTFEGSTPEAIPHVIHFPQHLIASDNKDNPLNNNEYLVPSPAAHLEVFLTESQEI